MRRPRESSSDLERLETRVLEFLDDGLEVPMEDLRREFPRLEVGEIERVRTSARILMAWLAGPSNGSTLTRGGSGEAGGADWLEAGEGIGGYRVLRRIPGGGMGQVYQAVQESLYPRQVALKVYRLGSSPQEALNRARREAEVASRLSHSHLVAIHDMGHDEERGLAYFSMQFVDGPDLREELRSPSPRRGSYQVRRLVTRASEVAGALAELHGRGYVHRDVKPENILLRRSGGRDGQSEAAVLVDFGLVRAEDALGVGVGRRSQAGTPGYRPPEADRPGHAVKPAWDVYSLGVVLYEVLFGRPLERDGDGWPRRPAPAEIAALRSWVPAVDRDLQAVLLKATAADPRARYPDAGALQLDLERWLAGAPVSARRPPAPERLLRAARRMRRRRLLLLLVLPLVPFSFFEVGRTVHGARRGLAEVAEGNLIHGWQRLAQVPLAYLGPLLQGRPDLRGDLFDGVARTPIARVVEVQRFQGPLASFELAAAFLQGIPELPEGDAPSSHGLRSVGLDDHPELAAYLLHGLESREPGVRAAALRTLGRLLLESPVEDPEVFERTRPLRDRVARLLEDSRTGAAPATLPGAGRGVRAGSDPLTRSEQLHAVQVLGGCGSPADLMGLLEWMESASDEWEVLRLGLRTTERILRRARPIGAAGELTPGEWARFGERSRRLIEGWTGGAGLWLFGENDVRHHTCYWTEAWMVLRRAGWGPAPGPPEPFVPEGLWVTSLVLGVALSAGDPGFLAWLEGGPPRQALADLALLPDDLHAWGRACGLLGDEALTARIEERLGAGDHGPFRMGFAEGTEVLLRGPDPAQRPDEESHLHHLLAPPGDPGDPGVELDLEQDTNRAGPRIAAAWNFRLGPRRSGSARGLLLRGGAHPKDHLPGVSYDHLRLPRPGASVEFPFEAVPVPERSYALVTLIHTAAARPHVVHQGQAWIRVDLDGVPLLERMEVRDHRASSVRLPIAREAFLPGEHTLRVTLLEATTTYWIEGLRIEQASWEELR